jgi:RNA polymerase sigma factor (sigma-70 family)
MSWFHQLSGGKSCRPAKSSVSATAPPESEPRGVGSGGAVGSTEPEGAEGDPPQPAITSSSEHTKRRMARQPRQETDQLVRGRERNLFRPLVFTQSDGTVTDETLMDAVRTGDLAKLGILFERHHRALFDFLVRMTGNASAAEDLVQDVFVRVLKYRATWRGEGRFETWLFRIARNARADYFRTRTPDAPIEEAADHPSSAPLPGELLARTRDVVRLQRALMLLREDKRELIVLARYRGMKLEAIADLLGIEVGAVKVRIHRAVKELRDIFLRLNESPSWNTTNSVGSCPTT